MKKNKGITLVALIITIVIMLILVAVSINVLIKSNLLGTAERTGDKYKAAAEQEAKGGTVTIDGKEYDSIEDYLKKDESTSDTHNWQRTGDNLTCKHCNKTVTIGQELDYKDNGKGTSSISAEKAGGSSEIVESMLNSGIKIASLNSNVNIKIAGWTPPAEAPTTTQTINRDSNTKWIVLGIEDSDKNGTNETLLITTKQPTTGKITLYGAGAYNNAMDEINRMCKELYGEEAEGMTIEDVNNCLAYTPAGGMYYQNSKYNSIGNLTTKLKNIPIWDAIKGNHQTPDGVNTEEVLGEYELNGYEYSVSSDGTYLVNNVNPTNTSNTITTATKTLIFGTDNSYHYWLASRWVYVSSDCVCFGLGTVSEGNAGTYGGLFDSTGLSFDDELSLRAVVHLRSEIPAVVK